MASPMTPPGPSLTGNRDREHFLTCLGFERSHANKNFAFIGHPSHALFKLPDFSEVFNALRERLNEIIKSSGPPDLLVFSGDVVQAGANADDFDFAREKFIEP